MSSIIIVTGRVTADPVMQQAKNSGTEYISLGLATNQRGQNGKEDPIFYQCYCNKFLADRLIKAGVKKSTCLMVYGDLELHPYALYPYIALQDCLVVDMERIEDTPIIYNTITQKVYENGQWSKQDLDLHGKLLIYVKSSPPMPAATEQINNGF